VTAAFQSHDSPASEAMHRTRPTLFAALLALSACGADGGEPSADANAADGGARADAATGADNGYATCDPTEDLGGYQVDLGPKYSTVRGRVWDGVSTLRLLKEVASSGSEPQGTCRLLAPDNPVCSPACTPGKECGTGGKCIAAPRKRDVGEVTITGLANPVAMSAIAPINEYNFTGDLDHPAFVPGAKVRLKAAGGSIAPFAIAATGITPLVITHHKPTVVAGMAVEVTWTAAPAAATHVRVAIELNVNQHGTSGARIHCDVADDGAFAIPATLVDKLLGYGTSGFPSIAVTRQSAGTASIEGGCAALSLTSSAYLEVHIPGLVSCSSDKDCPSGQSCKPELICG